MSPVAAMVRLYLAVAGATGLTYYGLATDASVLDAVGYGVLIGIAWTLGLMLADMGAWAIGRRVHRADDEAEDEEDEEKAAPKSYEIGDKTFYPIRVTLPVMRRLMEVQVAPPEPQVQGMYLVHQWTAENRIAHMESLYKQLSILLADDNNEHPAEDYLGVYLTVEEAGKMLGEIVG